jgi:4-aminobutyrate aminotransferase-like enzyme
VLEIMERDGLPARAEQMGAALRAKLEALPQVTSVRGAGLILAAEIGPLDAKAVYGAALERGLVVNAITPTALRLTPPLTVSDAEIDEAVAILADVLAGARVPETV